MTLEKHDSENGERPAALRRRSALVDEPHTRERLTTPRRTEIGIDLFVAGTLVLLGVILPSMGVPSIVGSFAAILVALGTLIVGTAEGRSV